jgi:hypothetical protein
VADEEVLRRLDRIAAILQLAHREEIASAREAVRADKANAAILDAAKDWTPAGKLTEAASRRVGQSPRNIRNKISALIEQGLLEKTGGGSTTAYRATGLV